MGVNEEIYRYISKCPSCGNKVEMGKMDSEKKVIGPCPVCRVWLYVSGAWCCVTRLATQEEKKEIMKKW